MSTEADTSHPTADRPLVLEWEHAKVGDRLSAFTLFLPARPVGPVLLAVSAMVGTGLRWRYPDAVQLMRAGADTPLDDAAAAIVRWDGRNSPLAPASTGLIIVDARHADPELLRPALAPGGSLAVLGPAGDLVVYPDVDRPENIWRRGWPIPAMRTVRAQVRRTVGLRIGVGRELIRLQVDGPPAPTFLDELMADLRTQTGFTGVVQGVQTAGDTIVRVRQPGRDLAVRVSLTIHDRNFGYGDAVAAEAPAIEPFVQQPVAAGTTLGVRWIATEWLPRRRRSAAEMRRATGRQWAVAEELTEGLEQAVTGRVDPDWARQWCEPIAPIVPEHTLAELQAILADVPAGTPTGWAHGDLWPGNVLVDGDTAAVIDWENCARNAPLGLDWLLIAALQARMDEGISVAAGCARLIGDPQLLDRSVAGRPWAEWDRPQRVALAVAAYVLHLRNRALFDLGFAALDHDLAEIIAAAHDVAPPPSDSAGDVNKVSGAGRAARGALWLGTSALVVKGLQTVVLLVLAKLLVPAEFGLVAIGTLVMNVSTVVSDLGTSSALVYFRGDVRRAARSAVTVAALLGLAIVAIVWGSAPAISAALNGGSEGADVIRGLACALPFQVVATVHLELMRRALQFARRIVPDVIAGSTGAVVSIVLAVMGHGVAALVVGQVVQGVLTLLVAWAVSSPVLPGWNTTDLRTLLGYGGHLSGSNLAQLALLNIDYVIVSRVLGRAALGSYSLAFRLAYLPYLNIATVIGGAAFPYLCRLRGPKLGTTAERIAGVTITATVPLCAAAALLADQLQLLGTKWAPAVPAVRWLMLYAVVLSAGQIVQVALNSAGRPRTTLGLRVLHVCALGVVLVILAPHGLNAVAIGQVIAVVFVTAVAAAIATRRLPGFALTRLLSALGPVVVGAALMTVVMLGLGAVLPGPDVSVFRLVVLGLAGLIAYALPVWLLDRVRILSTLTLLRAGR